MIKWNNEVKLIFADVDSTIADVYTDATTNMIKNLEKILDLGLVLFLISGGSKKSIVDRVISKIKNNRQNIILAHCMGAEIIEFTENGEEIKPYYYSSYEQLMSNSQKKEWRNIMENLINEFGLEIFPPINPNIFAINSGNDPKKIIYDDRGPQITFEIVNAPQMRESIVTKAMIMIDDAKLPIDIALGGRFAIDFHLKGVNKTSTVQRFMGDKNTLKKYNLLEIIKFPEKYCEIWGDKFYPDGSDFKICKALPKGVRTIDFCSENPILFERGYNIQIWDGKKPLEEGLDEYLESI
jgi:hydroxymethylpyrimidine pyrophosphatase-like HAD family hydrolase